MSKVGKWSNRIFITVLATFLIAFFTAGCLQDLIAPCYIEQEAIEYSQVEVKKNIPYTSLWDAKRVQLGMEYQHHLRTIELNRDLMDEDIYFNFINDAHLTHVKNSNEFKNTVFSPGSPIGLAISGLGFGTIGALCIKRPGDKSEKQIKAENGNATT